MARTERFFDGGLLVKEITVDDEETADPVELAPDIASLSLVKAVEETRYTLGVAYPVNKLDVGKARDGRRDFASAAVVERACFDWMSKSQDIGLFHESGTEGHGLVVENFIWRWGDFMKDDPDSPWAGVGDGDWLLGVLWDPPAWSLVKDQYVRGYSPQGFAKRSLGPVSAEKLASLRS